MNNQLNIRILEAVQELMTEYVFYTPILNRLRFYSGSSKYKTMAIDANLVIYVNEDFANGLTDFHLKEVILHEVLHYANGHHQRFMDNPYKDRIPHSIHNIAMDLEVNEFVPRDLYNSEEVYWFRNEYKKLLTPEEIEQQIEEKFIKPKLSENAFRAKDFGLPANKSYEEYLGILDNNMPEELKTLMEQLMSQGEPDRQDNENENEGGQKTNFPFDDIDIENYSDINKELLIDLLDECEEQHQIRLSQKYEYEAADTVRKIGRKQYSWDVVFRNILSAKVSDIIAGFKYRTYLKPNRRHLSEDIIFSAYIDYESKIDIAIIMDISGSMAYMIDDMYALIKSIADIQELKINCTILEVDSCVQNVIHNFNFNASRIESKDGGGTYLPAGWEYLMENNMASDMDLIICMTDTETEWEPLLVEKSVVLGTVPVKPDDCPYTYFPVIFPEPDYSSIFNEYGDFI